MVRIGLISDTHGYLDDAVFTHFKDCDEVWHAGDIGGNEVAEKLTAFKPFRAVYGNIDGREIRQLYPEDLKFTVESCQVWMTHIGGYPGRYDKRISQNIKIERPSIFISGHSHILKVMFDEKIGTLHLNPGAAGKSGWHKVRTLLRFCITDDKIHNLELIEMGNR